MRSLWSKGRRLVPHDAIQLERELPLFLCPALAHSRPIRQSFESRQSQDLRKRTFSTSNYRRSAHEVRSTPLSPATGLQSPLQTTRELPISCPGCGAPTQVSTPGEAGFYNTKRHAVKQYLRPQFQGGKEQEDEIYRSALKQADQGFLENLGMSEESKDVAQVEPTVPFCDRCHNLLNHREGTPIYHPSVESIEEMIEDSPHVRNHIYHVVDAVDFPMSLIPNLQSSLSLSPMRTRNRRSKQHQYSHNRIAEVSFIITRADLLGARKEHVDALLPYLKEVLRDALGRSGKNVRLGNVRCVSAQRGWWTRQVKADILERGGAAWMVGKANVGKSSLFEVVYPKGSNPSKVNIDELRQQSLEAPLGEKSEQDTTQAVPESDASTSEETRPMHDPTSLLPPAQKETMYPVMPIVSDLPGTTAAPIRVPFGRGKGELIDLPGLARCDLERFVKPEHRREMIMRTRQAPEKIVIKPGQSLLLGGLIRITPTSPDLIYIAHPFVTLAPHVTSTEKAIHIQSGTSDLNVPTIIEESASQQMRSAGTFNLEWDVTMKQTGTLTARDAGKLKAAALPFIVYSTDIVIEGVGWVEVTCQVRKRQLEQMRNAERFDALVPAEQSPESSSSIYPQIEVFSPHGKYILRRRTMNGSVIGGKKEIAKHARKKRPRRSMKFMKSLRRNQPVQSLS